MSVQDLIKNGAMVVDVRSGMEYAGGHVSGSINIPLDQVQERIDEFKNLNQPFVVCCLSGGRSGQAVAFLQGQGIDCVNGGGWAQVNALV